jgi:predicted membrane GTPase involved in stress response
MTPKSIRIRKAIRNELDRKRAASAKREQAAAV